MLALIVMSLPAFAVKPIPVTPDADRIEITALGELYDSRGDSLQIETAAGADGVTGRMQVRAATPGTNPNWVVFALSNPGDKPIERWLTAERYTVTGSGLVWPDLDARRIEAVTPSLGFVPERIKSDRADIFRVTLDPGQVITYVAELSTDHFARISLWKPIDYEIKIRDRLLFNGIMLGLTGLLAVFLTAIFAANHKAIFPSAALVAWCVLAYLCVDFGFFHKLFQLRPEDNAVYRAAAEASMAASLVIFLHTFLRLGLWHGLIRMLIGVWMVGQLSLIAVAIIDPKLAATFARGSFLLIGVLGTLFTLLLALRGQDRALSLIPTWMLLMVWIFGAAMTLTGRLNGDIAVSMLVAGLVLIVMLIGFTVTQFAFRSLEPLYGASPNEHQMRSLAVDGAGAAVWEWNARRDEIKISPLVEMALGLQPGELSVKTDEFIKHLHNSDRERFRLSLWSIQERAGGRIQTDFRLRGADGTYRNFELEAASVPGADRRAVRCVGLVRDITDAKRAQERLLHDAVHCSLTGLPHRDLFLDRLTVAVNRARVETSLRPTILFIDIDKFKSVNTDFGLVIGDTLLLTVARRLQRHIGPFDTLARVGGDQFAMLLMAEMDSREIAALAERIRRSLRSPIKLSGQEITLTGSLGIAIYDGEEETPAELLKEAEIAMYRAKRSGADRIEVFRPEMRAERDDRVAIESDLRVALEKGHLKVFYQPIIYLPTEQLAGFEALVRWDHPKRGPLPPSLFIPIAEQSDLITKLGSYVLVTGTTDAARWQKEMPRGDEEGPPLFVSINVSSRQLFRQDLVQEIRHIVGRAIVPKGALRLELTESLLMENPERAAEILEMLRGAGAGLALDDFGTGYSSLAYLQRFAFDTIKIDKALIQSSSNGEGAGSTIVRSIVALAHELGKSVVAEGVETAEDVSFLRALGCEYAQGFYYGEPMPDREVIKLLRMIKRTERKLQPRGMFRLKKKPAGTAPPSNAGIAAKDSGKGGNAGAAPPAMDAATAGAASEGAGPTDARAERRARAQVQPPALPNTVLKPRAKLPGDTRPAEDAKGAPRPRGLPRGLGGPGAHTRRGPPPAPAQQTRALAPAPEPQGRALAPAPEPQGRALAPAPEPQGRALAPAPEPQGREPQGRNLPPRAPVTSPSGPARQAANGYGVAPAPMSPPAHLPGAPGHQQQVRSAQHGQPFPSRPQPVPLSPETMPPHMPPSSYQPPLGPAASPPGHVDAPPAIPQRPAAPDLSHLPPSLAASLAKLAGVPVMADSVTPGHDEREKG